MTPLSGTVEAHGIGGQADLPISLELAVSGAVAALVVSFTVLVVAWRRPRYDGGAHPGRPAPAWLDRVSGSAAFPVVLRVVGMLVALYTVFTAVLGQNTLTNPFFGIFYVWWWVGLVFASALFGPVWRAISPVRTINAGIARLAGSDPDEGLVRYPERLGLWPAALGLFAFVWLELASTHPTELGSVRLWCAIYVGAMLIGGAVFGNRFYENADPFEVYSSLIAKLSPWARVDGRLVLRSPLANLSTIPPTPGLVGVVAVLFGSTAFDSFAESAFWVKTYQNASVSKFLLDNVALVVFCLTAGLLFSIGSALTPSRADVPRRQLARHYAHSIVPIVLGYIVAHYLTLFIDVGTQTLARASDPLGKGWDILGTAAVEPSYWFSYHPEVLATVKVLAVVIGHVVAAVAAHDRALSLLPKRDQITGQLPLLFVMVGFTAGGLFLLFSS
ncbi:MULTISPECIES: hypothetical protein [unclassified Nocardioides]|uniref:hypothetical protein n=1 Tax=unclassified Nocardioides TaxID=2615069 RepID=UPI0011504565|nr:MULTISPECIES: hypothetical protein [unclassified Nocardioides]TQK70221.1 hypothetical protein FBY23_1995 [Nocardioides sp. SLBN-35]WGY00552.1 hypothetical protein QI633_18635 [Nocardioides sp. QY071]